jgi:hypothetical protein
MSTLKNSEALAEVLKESPPALDDLARARIEKKVLARTAAPARSKSGYWIAGASACAVAAAALIWIALPREETVRGPTAEFEVHQSRASMSRGTLEEGSTLETSATEVADIRVADSRVHIDEGSRVRIGTLSSAHFGIELEQGSVRVGFHPRERGEERMTVETARARVEVVGTEFIVRVDGDSTFVRVTEGVVRVVPREGAARLVRAGEETVVGGQAREERAEVVPPPAIEEPVVRAEATDTVVDEDPRARLAQARRSFDRGQHEEALRILRTLTRPPTPAGVRVDAWMLSAEVHRATGAHQDAAGAYDRAARAGRGTLDGENAIFELARLQERQLHDRDGARASYERYLSEAPEGANATTVRRELCRLGASEHCGP